MKGTLASAMPVAASATDVPNICVKVCAQSMNVHTKRKVNPARSCNAPISMALWYQHAPYDPRYRPVFQQLGGGLLSVALLSAAIPRVAPDDLKVWKALQAAILLLDIAMLWSVG